MDKLADCGKKGPTPLSSVTYDLAFIVHVTEDDQEARVDEVMLTNSTLHLQEVEDCMADALREMRTPLEALALRRHRVDPSPHASPEARSLFGQLEAALFLEIAVPIVVTFAVYNVVVQVILDKPRPKPRPHSPTPDTAEPPPAIPPVAVATAEPTVTVAPTATSVPTTSPVSRKDACRDMFVECQEKAGPCVRVTTRGHTICRICQTDCLAGKAYSYSECQQCGFQ